MKFNWKNALKCWAFSTVVGTLVGVAMFFNTGHLVGSFWTGLIFSPFAFVWAEHKKWNILTA